MKIFTCYAKVVGTKWLGDVEAENAKDALKLANELDTCYVSVCHQCAEQIDSPEIDEVFVEEQK
jgi:hypothetical protein